MSAGVILWLWSLSC